MRYAAGSNTMTFSAYSLECRFLVNIMTEEGQVLNYWYSISVKGLVLKYRIPALIMRQDDDLLWCQLGKKDPWNLS